MWSRKGWLAAGAMCLASVVAIACVMDNWPNMLDYRDESVREPIRHSFSFELSLMQGAPGDSLRFSPFECHWRDTPQSCALVMESDGLSPEQAAILKAVRAGDGDAYAAGDGLPVAIRHYAAGAMSFHAKHYDEAERHFRAILALPEDSAKPRLVWATYMLGRTLAAQNRVAEAAAEFAQTRSLALRGLPDPHGLAVASFGEQARIPFRRAKAVLGDGELDPVKAAEYTAALAEAAALYLEQALRDDEGGENSLRVIVRHLRAHRSTAEAAARHPMLRRLMVANTLANFLWTVPDPDQVSETDAYRWEEDSPVVPSSALAVLVADAVRAEKQPVPDMDRLAALAYREARYDLAAELVEKATGPMASWVRAKLALQAGDETLAARHYAEAAKAFPNSEVNPLDPRGATRISVETGVLVFSRGDYTQALLLLMDTDHWGDVAAIGERVLTLAELKAFVDARPAKDDESDDESRLRDLLARRLVRAHRIAEALPYFTRDEVRAVAAEYLAALNDAEHRWSRQARGEAWYKAAQLARNSGIEMMGTEGPPDDYGCCVADIKPANDAEAKRLAVAPAEPGKRFHYRYIAADHAQKAADMLPPRSQAFAAVLCSASHWMQQSGETEKSWDIYQRYVREGAHVPFARRFGRNCPDPDFAAAPASERRLLAHQARAVLSANRWPLAGLLTSLVVGTGWWLNRRRRGRG